MEEFTRARSEENKRKRYAEIMKAADDLYQSMPYSEITLTKIAEQLSWTRANLYKYVSTKEEIFLSITEEKLLEYYKDLLSAYPEGSTYTPETLSEVWATVLSSHKDYLHYASILTVVIETNVSIERLTAFKKCYIESADTLARRLSANLGISQEAASQLQLSVYHQATGLYGLCTYNPLLKEAMKRLGREYRTAELSKMLKDFILMSLKWTLEER